jgi:hypothetical protein
MSNKTIIQSHNTRLNNLLEDINNLPEAGGIELPVLDNEGAAADILSGKQLINQEGEIIEGTMPNNGNISQTMDGINITSVTIPSGYTQGGSVSLDNTIGNEVATQTDLITQIAAAVDGLPEVEGGDGSSGMGVCSLTVTAKTTASSLTVYYTQLNESNQIVSVAQTIDTLPVSTTFTLTNILCSTCVFILANQTWTYGFCDVISGDVENLYMFNSTGDYFGGIVLKMSAIADENCSIILDDD